MIASNKLIFIVLVAIVSVRCTQPVSTDSQILVDTDIAFADMAKTEGVGPAFIAYADSNAIIMQNERLPLKGIEEITAFHVNTPTDLTLSWHPEKAEIAGSGDMGYTFGKYTLTYKNTIEHGHYVTIWKKSKSGEWKYVLDTGTKNPD